MKKIIIKLSLILTIFVSLVGCDVQPRSRALIDEEVTKGMTEEQKDFYVKEKIKTREQQKRLENISDEVLTNILLLKNLK